MYVEVLYGDFPKEPNDIMLPYCFANYISKVFIDYKVDKVEDLIGKDFIFAKSRYYESDEEYYTFKICGIFEEGAYYTDYEENLDKNIENFYWQTNMLAKSVILAPQAQEIMFNNAYLFNGGAASFGKFVKFYDLIAINNSRVNPYAYDRYSDYAQEYPPLEKGEVYLDKAFAESKGIKVGDILTNTKLEYYNFNGKEESDFDGMVVKGIFDLPNKKNFVIFSQEDYYIVAVDNAPRAFWGYYFNAKNVKDNYKFFNNILSEGKKLDIFTTGFLENVYTENINSTSIIYNILVAFRYYAFLPAMLLSFSGMLAMGFVSFSYLISAKAKSYNVLRALGFGKKNISLLLFVQIFAVIFIECILGVTLGYLSCNLLGKAIGSFSNAGVPSSIANEVALPMGYIAPIIMIGLSLILGGVIVLSKTHSLFKKSIMENKTS